MTLAVHCIEAQLTPDRLRSRRSQFDSVWIAVTSSEPEALLTGSAQVILRTSGAPFLALIATVSQSVLAVRTVNHALAVLFFEPLSALLALASA